MDDNKIYIINPNIDKPVKIICEGLPCPILMQIEVDYRCKYAKSQIDDMDWTLYCSIGLNNCEKIKTKKTL